MKRTIVRLALAAVVGSVACGTARRGEPLMDPPRLKTAGEWHGQRLFQELCSQCHPGGEAGLAPSLNNRPIPSGLVKMQVRKGLGRMPAFPEIGDRDMDDLVSYMKALREKP